MPFSKKIVPEFWNHKELVAGEKGQQYIFRSKWVFLMQVICAVTLIPLILSTFFFYRTNKTETITDLLLETAVLARGAAVDIEIYLDQYLSTLRVISSQFSAADLKNKTVLESISMVIKKTNIKFSSLNIIDKNGAILFGSGKDNFLTGHRQFDLKGLIKDQDHYIGQIITENGNSHLFVSLKIVQDNGDSFFLAGIIDSQATALFLEKLKVREVMDIYILDNDGLLVTRSDYFGKPGSGAISPQSPKLPSSEVLANPNKNRKGGSFLFSGLSKIGDTDMKVGILMSNHNFEVFMTRIRFHITIMAFLSVLFISIAVLLLVTYVVQVLYRADKVRQVYLTKAARNSKMASIGQLAAGVAHEINNPLAIINEKAGLLQDLFSFLEVYKSDERVLSAVDSILRAVERAGTITHRLLGFARKTDSSIQAINVNETIQEVLGFIRKEAEYKSITLDVHIPQPFPEVISDRGKLQQILINLFNNSVAAMDEKGTLTVEAHDNFQNKSIKIIVQDDGCGISKDHQKKIFEPFFTTKTEIGGTGLGLSLTYGLIRDLHGTLELDSEPGVGTTFIITLPYEINEEESP